MYLNLDTKHYTQNQTKAMLHLFATLHVGNNQSQARSPDHVVQPTNQEAVL